MTVPLAGRSVCGGLDCAHDAEALVSHVRTLLRTDGPLFAQNAVSD